MWSAYSVPRMTSLSKPTRPSADGAGRLRASGAQPPARRRDGGEDVLRVQRAAARVAGERILRVTAEDRVAVRLLSRRRRTTCDRARPRVALQAVDLADLEGVV